MLRVKALSTNLLTKGRHLKRRFSFYCNTLSALQQTFMHFMLSELCHYVFRELYTLECNKVKSYQLGSCTNTNLAPEVPEIQDTDLMVFTYYRLFFS